MAELLPFPSLFNHLAPDSPETTPEPIPDPPNPDTPPDPTLPPDAHARSLALDIRSSWIVEAPAGSGKTGLLIQRFLKLLADGAVSQPEEILAITFTRKATEEMRDRVVDQLEAAHTGAPTHTPFDLATRNLALRALDRDRRLGWNLLGNPRRINIRTIDSVCSQIMSGLPVLSGGAGHLQTTEDPADLYREAARNVLLRLGGPDPELDRDLRTLLRHRDADLANCETLLANMLQFREQWGDLIPVSRHRLEDLSLETVVLPRLNLALEQIVCAELTRLQSTFPQPFLDRLTAIAAEFSDRPSHNGQPSFLTVCRNRYNSPDARVADLEHWRTLFHLLITPSSKSWRASFRKDHLGFVADKVDKARLKELISEARGTPGLLEAITRVSLLPPAEYPPEQWIVVKALFRILREALAELQLVFAKHGRCDFAESSLQARSALSEDSGLTDLRATLGIELQHLLLDEMQDTSSAQYDLVSLLTHHWPGEHRTVFLVGDPKQSIYLFRQARVERFLRTMHDRRLGTLPLAPLRLTANFRSQPDLVRSFNHDFSLIFPPPTPANTDSSTITFSPVHPTRPPSSHASSRIWHTRILDPGTDTATAHRDRSEARQEDAQTIRDIILDWQSRPLPPGRSKPWSIAVLVRARPHLTEIIAALRGTSVQTSIPFRAIQVEQLGERPEVLDLFALTRALLHPADRVAWLSILRAPWSGLELVDLHLLTGQDDPSFRHHLLESLIETRAHLLPPSARDRVLRVAHTLHAGTAQRNDLPLAQIVERTWRSLGGPLPLTPTEHTNALRFLSLLDSLEDSIGRIDLAHLTRKLASLFADPSSEENAVDLTTIHQAKGLEWDVVLLPGIDRSTSGNSTALLAWEEIDLASTAAAHVLLAPVHGSGESAKALNQWINHLHKHREAEERKRLVYVACTRAREELHLFATLTRQSSGKVAAESDSLLSAAWPAVRHLFDQPAATLAEPASEAPQPILLDLAASAEEQAAEPRRAPNLFRLPDGIDPLTGSTSTPSRVPPPTPDLPPAPIPRPSGSLLARTVGNTVHALLDHITQQIASGQTAPDLLAQLPSWRPRISTLLRSGGIPPRDLDRLTRDVLSTLTRSLTQPTSLWLLYPRAHAETELSVTSWTPRASTDQLQTIRVDRLFLSGAHPLTDPSTEVRTCLWLVDYKTATHGRSNLQQFLTAQRELYAPQLETYARLLEGYGGTTQTRVALYFPNLDELLCWQPPTASPTPDPNLRPA